MYLEDMLNLYVYKEFHPRNVMAVLRGRGFNTFSSIIRHDCTPADCTLGHNYYVIFRNNKKELLLYNKIAPNAFFS